MSVVWLAKYVCGIFVLLALLASAVTYHPDIQSLGLVLPAAFGCMAILAGGLAVRLGRLPPNHRIHQSMPLWAACIAMAVTVALLLVMIG